MAKNTVVATETTATIETANADVSFDTIETTPETEIIEGQAQSEVVFDAMQSVKRVLDKALNPFNVTERRFVIGLSQLVEATTARRINEETSEPFEYADFKLLNGQPNAELRAQIHGFLFDEYLPKDKATQTKFQSDFFGIYGFLSNDETDSFLDLCREHFAELLESDEHGQYNELLNPVKTMGMVLYKTTINEDGEVISEFDKTAITSYNLSESDSLAMKDISEKLTAAEIGAVQNVTNLLQENMFRQLGKTEVKTDKNGKETEKFIPFPVKARRFIELLQLHFRDLDADETQPLIISTSSICAKSKESKSAIEDGRRTLVKWQLENNLVLVEITSTDNNSTSYKLNYRPIVTKTAHKIFANPDNSTMKFLFGEALDQERLLTAKRTLQLESGTILESMPKDESDTGGQTLSESQKKAKDRFEAERAQKEAEKESARIAKELADQANATEKANDVENALNGDFTEDDADAQEATKTPLSALQAMSTQISLWKMSFISTLPKLELTLELSNILHGIANEANEIAEICEDHEQSILETIGHK